VIGKKLPPKNTYQHKLWKDTMLHHTLNKNETKKNHTIPDLAAFKPSAKGSTTAPLAISVKGEGRKAEMRTT
jgi:hypothetical protein